MLVALRPSGACESAGRKRLASGQRLV